MPHSVQRWINSPAKRLALPTGALLALAGLGSLFNDGYQALGVCDLAAFLAGVGSAAAVLMLAGLVGGLWQLWRDVVRLETDDVPTLKGRADAAEKVARRSDAEASHAQERADLLERERDALEARVGPRPASLVDLARLLNEYVTRFEAVARHRRLEDRLGQGSWSVADVAGRPDKAVQIDVYATDDLSGIEGERVFLLSEAEPVGEGVVVNVHGRRLRAVIEAEAFLNRDARERLLKDEDYPRGCQLILAGLALADRESLPDEVLTGLLASYQEALGQTTDTLGQTRLEDS